jgi:hypothetical protein
MILRIVALKVSGPRQLDLAFNNGVRKRVDVSPLLEGSVFKPLQTKKGFAEARLDDVCGTVVWPNGADFAPETLFALPAMKTTLPGKKRRPRLKTGN